MIQGLHKFCLNMHMKLADQEVSCCVEFFKIAAKRFVTIIMIRNIMTTIQKGLLSVVIKIPNWQGREAGWKAVYTNMTGSMRT